MAYRPRTRIWTPAALPDGVVALPDLKAHLRVTADDEDAYIASLGRAATLAVEKWTQRLLTVRQATLLLPGLPTGRHPVELPGGAVASVTSVTAEGAAVTGATAVGAAPAILLPASDWPAVTGEGYPVSIVYQVGYSVVPPDLAHAVKMLVADMYDIRQNQVQGPSSKAIIGAEYLMSPHRIWAAA